MRVFVESYCGVIAVQLQLQVSFKTSIRAQRDFF